MVTKHSYRVLLVLIIFVFAGCQQPSNHKVHYTGALKTIMSGDLNATTDLDSLSRRKYLYALGAVENLKGEIQVFSGEPVVSSVKNAKVIIDNSFNNKAALLVYAQVKYWRDFTIPDTVKSKDELEAFIVETAASKGIDTALPFPFLITGTIKNLGWHVIDWKSGDMEHSHQKHKNSGLNGVLSDTTVEVLGFYSDKHKGIFTHHTTNMHLHFKTEDQSLAGHVDDLILGESMTLKLPEK